MKKKIKICDGHEYKVPLLWTFAFNGSEYWCPYCGINGGMFGTGTDALLTEALVGRQEIYSKYSEYYLRTRGLILCSGFKFENKEYRRKEMPVNIENKLNQFAKNNKWKYRIKATSLFRNDIIDFPEFKCVDCIYFGCELLHKERDQGKNGPCEKWDDKKIKKLEVIK